MIVRFVFPTDATSISSGFAGALTEFLAQTMAISFDRVQFLTALPGSIVVTANVAGSADTAAPTIDTAVAALAQTVQNNTLIFQLNNVTFHADPV